MPVPAPLDERMPCGAPVGAVGVVADRPVAFFGGVADDVPEGAGNVGGDPVVHRFCLVFQRTAPVVLGDLGQCSGALVFGVKGFWPGRVQMLWVAAVVEHDVSGDDFSGSGRAGLPGDLHIAHAMAAHQGQQMGFHQAHRGALFAAYHRGQHDQVVE